jgi:hypothetical protein
MLPDLLPAWTVTLCSGRQSSRNDVYVLISNLGKAFRLLDVARHYMLALEKHEADSRYNARVLRTNAIYMDNLCLLDALSSVIVLL